MSHLSFIRLRQPRQTLLRRCAAHLFPTSSRGRRFETSRRAGVTASTITARTNKAATITVATITATLFLVTSAFAASPPQFSRDVRPILAQACFHCHGPDAANRQADLRLDEEAGLRTAFLPRDLAKSEAWRRIQSTDPAERMPPPESPHQLKPAQIDTLRRWIEAGAEWQGHWAFIPPTKPAPPAVKDARWGAHPIDAFVLARLEAEGLKPQPEADRERLLRRVSFDLIGLPPTSAEIDAFLADREEKAFERVVDRLLSSEHFGERMALAWLDAARYGDSSVFHADGPRDMWAWRDWTIRAYNRNLPFDRFTIEQLAGDLLPDATDETRIATGFLRNNATTDEGGAIAEEFRVEYAIDRVKTTSVVWMGLTMECGQCHNHKYDPITQQDYYRFFAYFNQSADPGMQTRRGNQAPFVNVIDPAAQQAAAALAAQLPPLETKLAERAQAAEPDFLAWAKQEAEKRREGPALPGNPLLHAALDETSGAEAKFLVGGEPRQAKVAGTPLWSAGKVGGAFQLDGDNHLDLGDVANFERTESFSYGAWVKPAAKPNGAFIARMDDSNGFRGFDVMGNGNGVAVHLIHSWPANAIKVNTKNGLKPDEWQHLLVTYDGSSKAAGIAIYFDGKKQEWIIEQDRLSDSIRTDKPLRLGRRSPGSPAKGLIDEVRVYARQLTDAEALALAGADPYGPTLAKAPADWTPAERETLRTHYLNGFDPQHQQLSKEIARLKAESSASLKPLTTVMVMQDEKSPRMTYVLNRGSYSQPRKDEPVQPGIPASLGSLPADSPPNRLGLARWLASPNHPLTSRVAVNRLWQQLFGQGLVRTVEDFGSQGEWPSHPELLDWLATDFTEHGWDVKRVMRQLVLSNTYRQSSRATNELLERDPDNRMLARGPRFRLQGELIRDNALAASGLLVRDIGGPSVKPYQPPGLWEEVTISNERYVPDSGPKLYRRGMYTYWKRSAPPPSLIAFDAPTRESCVVRRSRTNTPLQALVSMNDPQFVEAARALAQRAMKEGGATPESRIVLAYRLATGVRPTDFALRVLLEGYSKELEVFRAQPDRAKKLLSVGESKRDESLDPAEHAALATVSGLILNLDATLSRG